MSSVVVMRVGRRGSQKACYLAKTATPRELFYYIEAFRASVGASGGRFSTGPRAEFWLSHVEDGNGDCLAIVFRDFRRESGCLIRAYKVYQDRVAMIYDKIGASADTPGYHAWFISAHLMIAWINRCQEQQAAVAARSS